MDEEESLRRAIHEPVHLSAYDPAWPRLFEAERARLFGLFPRAFVAIEHFGSTAVPGLSAKPVIDMLGGVASMDQTDALLEALCGAGYTTSRAFNDSLQGRRWLMRWTEGRRTHHLHLVEHGGAEWRRRLAFRDALRADAGLAADYEQLKRRLAATHGHDREAYTSAKAAFVRDVLCRYGGK